MASSRNPIPAERLTENARRIHWNLSAPRLVEEAVRRGEGALTGRGALAVSTGKYTGRSPADRFIVADETTEGSVDWGAVNLRMTPERFERLESKVRQYLQTHEAYGVECFAGALARYSMPLRVVTETAWHSLFARQLFVRTLEGEAGLAPFHLAALPGLHSDPETDGTRSEAFVVINIARRMVLIGGTRYAGEIKKSVFSTLNYLLPECGVLPMHCSANAGPGGDVIGDDEHGWSPEGVFNFEGGCYAKCIHLSRSKEPEIWDALRFGAVLENVAVDPATREPDYDDGSLTENTRAAYPIGYIANAAAEGAGGHPAHVVFLTADAFGVLPPISKLSPAQAMYHFLSGYTAKVAGTERGLGDDPEATFSACFGAPFLPRHPSVYAEMLGSKLREHGSQCWLLNTGWAGGPYGVGRRMDLPLTRAMLAAALSGKLEKADFKPHPVFGLEVPQSCPGVPADKLDARGMWADRQAYDQAARRLAGKFQKNFERFDSVPEEVRAAGPKAD